MAVLTRTSQTAEFCHRQDPAVVFVAPGPEQDWVSAVGQTPEATRFRVRPLSQAEVDATSVGADYLVGLLAIDGEPVVLDDLSAGWKTQIANLVAAVTIVPFGGLISRSRAEPLPASSAPG